MLWFTHQRDLDSLKAEVASIYGSLRESSAYYDAHIGELQETADSIKNELDALRVSLRETDTRNSDALGPLQEAVEALSKAVAALEKAAASPESSIEREDYTGWPAELLKQIDWARWGRTPPRENS